jgi:hypothetical protein
MRTAQQSTSGTAESPCKTYVKLGDEEVIDTTLSLNMQHIKQLYDTVKKAHVCGVGGRAGFLARSVLRVAQV